MPDIRFRMFFDNNPATLDQLERVEEITVEQEVDMAWEARIQIPIYLDDNGSWVGEDERFMRSFSRLRVEIQVDKLPFMPLIDGPIVKYDNQKSSKPGESIVIMIVQDDSVYLNRRESVVHFENMSDHEIAMQIFRGIEQIASFDIEAAPKPPGTLPPIVVQRSTEMQLLRFLARRQGKHAYVLPGNEPGLSIGCFKDFPVQTDGLPPLILLGKDRNIETFHIKNNVQRPATVRAATISICDKKVIKATTHFNKIDLLGEAVPWLENEADKAIQILPPYQGESVDLDHTVTAESANLSYAFEATGSILDHFYQGVLQPYRVVSVLGGNSRLSGNYLVSKVTHTLTRSMYSQSFTMRRNAQSERFDSSFHKLAEGMATNLVRSIF